jgi:hypothetical protein
LADPHRGHKEISPETLSLWGDLPDDRSRDPSHSCGSRTPSPWILEVATILKKKEPQKTFLYRIILSALASTFGGTMVILDFRFFGHRITLSALANTFGDIVNPICFAVLRLTTNSNFVGCSTGRSAGFVPFRILST